MKSTVKTDRKTLERLGIFYGELWKAFNSDGSCGYVFSCVQQMKSRAVIILVVTCSIVNPLSVDSTVISSVYKE